MKLTKNFTLEEFACHDGTPVPKKYIANVTLLAQNLQVLRDYLNEAVRLNSGYRTVTYNQRVGGKPGSKHLTAEAGDLTVKSKTPAELHAIIEMLIAEGKMMQGGLGLYPGFVHYDVRGTKARW